MLNLDMPAAAMIFGGFYFFFTGRYGFFIFFSTLAVLTKEPTILIFGIMAAFKLFWERRLGFIAVIKRNITLGIPVLALLGWWLFCRLHFGWWVDPIWEGYLLSSPLRRFPNLLEYSMFLEWRWLLFLGFVIFVFSSPRKKEIAISLAAIITCSIFFSFIFILRYLLIALPFVYVAYGLAIPERKRALLLYIPVIAVLVMGIAPADVNVHADEQWDMNYIKVINLHKTAFDYLDIVIQENDSVLVFWPHDSQAEDSRFGYSKRSNKVVDLGGISNDTIPMFAVTSNTYDGILKPQYDSFYAEHYEQVFVNSTYGNTVEVLKRKG
jgi:hypothetical protein